MVTWAKRIGVELKLITVRPISHKWGSCSSEGRLTFDRDLLYQPAAFRAEVIVHELLHIKYPYPHQSCLMQLGWWSERRLDSLSARFCRRSCLAQS